MKPAVVLALLFVVTTCSSHSHQEKKEHSGDERPDLSFTHWTDASELFIELPALVRGQPSACAAHVTKLDGFAALADGSVRVVLRGVGGDERFDVQAPTVPGIFRPIVQPTSSGKFRFIVEVRAQGLSADHDVGDVTVFDSISLAKAGIAEQPDQPGLIPFLKEQQWPMAFATDVVAARSIRSTLAVSGQIIPRSDGEVVITAPVAGRVASGGRAFPRLGDRVSVNELLGSLSPRLEAADLASLELAVTSANLEVRYAEREQQRLQGLQGEGAVPERRVQDATHAAESAKAALATSQRRLEQFRRAQSTNGKGQGAVQLRAPLSGTITEVMAAPGAFVEAGSALFRVTDITQLWLEARIPQSDALRLVTPRGASFLVEGVDESIDLPAQSVVARASRVDPLTQSLSMLFAVDNASARLPVGAFARVHVVNGEARQAIAVPESALVDDGGIFVVFVQVEGEAFERRVVRTGARDRGYVEVQTGVAVGEHVVTRGAWSVKLAASSGSVPAHGHAH